MAKILYLDASGGAAGDMILASLIDLGVPLAGLKRELAKLGLGGYSVSTRRVRRGAISARKLSVNIRGRRHHHRGIGDIRRMIARSRLPVEVKSKSIALFGALAAAEAKIHGVGVEEIHFHELGAVDSIVDIVGTVIALRMLGVGRIYASAFALGSGTVECAHGVLPLPAPATLELLRGSGASAKQRDVGMELTTPTGALLVSRLAGSFGPMPEMEIERIGYGAGTRETPGIPNVFRAILGSAPSPEAGAAFILETNVDDATGQILGGLFERLFAAGALDVYTTAIGMKKNRPGVKVSALCEEAAVPAVEEILFRETTTFGIRRWPVQRSKLRRRIRRVRTRYGVVAVKIGFMRGRILTVSPEYEDCRRLALRRGVPLRRVMEASRAAAEILMKG